MDALIRTSLCLFAFIDLQKTRHYRIISCLNMIYYGCLRILEASAWCRHSTGVSPVPKRGFHTDSPYKHWIFRVFGSVNKEANDRAALMLRLAFTCTTSGIIQVPRRLGGEQ